MSVEKLKDGVWTNQSGFHTQSLFTTDIDSNRSSLSNNTHTFNAHFITFPCLCLILAACTQVWHSFAHKSKFHASLQIKRSAFIECIYLNGFTATYWIVFMRMTVCIKILDSREVTVIDLFRYFTFFVLILLVLILQWCEVFCVLRARGDF